MKSVLITEASASLKKQVAEELQVPDPVNMTMGQLIDTKTYSRALTEEEIKDLNGQGHTP
jgi:hypothetical protein